MLNYLLYISLMIVLISSMPNVPPKDSYEETTESLTETPDAHDENYLFLGSLNSTHSEAYGVSGKVYAVNCTTLFIQDFSYDGTGIRVNFVAVIETEIKKQPSNIIIPDENGNTERIRRAYVNETFYLSLPENQSLAGVKWISFLCQSFNLNLGSVSASEANCDSYTIDEIVDACADEGNVTIVENEDSYKLGELFGEFRSTFYSLDYEVNATFYTVEDHPHQIYIRNFTYNGLAPLVYFYVGLTLNSAVNNFYVPSDYHTYDPCDIKDGFIVGSTIQKHVNQSMVINLPLDYTIHNIRWFMIWCRVYALDMGHVWNNHYSGYNRRKRESSTPELIDMGTLGSIGGKMYGVKGDVYAINSTTLFLSNFSYDGQAPDAYFYVGSTETVGVTGTIIPDENGSNSSIGAYENQNVTLHLPAGVTIKDFKWLSIFCNSYIQDFGHVRYDHLDLDDMLNKLDVQPIDTLTYEDQTETNVLGSKIETNMTEESEPETKTVDGETEIVDEEAETILVQDEKKEENEPEPKPEPNPESMAKAEKSESKAMPVSLSFTSKFVIAITIVSLILLR